MTWDHPWFLAAALTLPVIILLHLLARRRRTVVVPSLVLWERLLENQRRSVSLRRFTADLLLVLQLLTTAMLVLSLAGPRLDGGRNRITGPTVLVVDVSAGMSAFTGSKGTRLEAAVSEASELIRRKSAGTEVMVIAGGSEPRPVTGFLADKSDLITALKALENTSETGDPGRVIRAAEALAAGRPDAKVVFITDAAFDDGPRISGTTTVVQVGEPMENTGITAFAIRYLPGGGREALIAVENHGGGPRTAGLTIQAGEDELLAETLSITPGNRTVRSVQWHGSRAGEVTATLDFSSPGVASTTGPRTDGLVMDNRVSVVLTSEGPIRTALFTTGNWFLETLLTAHPDISLSVFQYGAEMGAGDENGNDPEAVEGAWDLVVADRTYPKKFIDAPLLAIYPFPEYPPPLPLEPLGQLGNTDPVFRDTGHPVTRNLDLSRISVRGALRVSVAPEARTLVSSASGPLLMAGENERGRWLAFLFDLLDSSLPLQPAFPILMSDAISWLTAGNPDVEYPAQSGFNVLSSGESDLSPRWTTGPGPDNAGSAETDRQSADRLSAPQAGPLGLLLAVLALLSVLAEWNLQTRTWRKA